MASEDLDGSPPSFHLDPHEEISLWLSSLHLSQYASSFAQAGYHILADCRGLTEEKLLQVGHFPTGHRRRILNSLGVPTVGDENKEVSEKAQERRKPVPFPRTIFKDKKSVTSAQGPETGNTGEKQNLAENQSLAKKVSSGGQLTDFSSTVFQTLPSSQGKTASSDLSSVSWHSSNDSVQHTSLLLHTECNFSEELTSLSSEPGTKEDFLLEGCTEGFQGVMVDNDIYESAAIFTAAAARSTRSYRLRHRPVPEIPEHTTLPPTDWSVSAKSNLEQHSSTEGPSSVRQKATLQRTISPYGEVYLCNNDAKTKQCVGEKEMLSEEAKEKQKQKKLRKLQEEQKEKQGENMCRRGISKQCTPGCHNDNENDDDEDDDYSLLQPCLSSSEPTNENFSNSAKSVKSLPETAPSLTGVDPHIGGIYSEPSDALSGLVRHTRPIHSETDISPYACFYKHPEDFVKMGWLDKLSPQGNRVFQRRWIKFDGENLTYYNNEKEMYSKGLVHLSAVKQLRSVGENKFEVVTAGRTFVFRAEKEGERQEWLEVLQAALKSRVSVLQTPCKRSSSKCGYVELRGHKGKVYLSLMGTKIRICKTDQDFNSGLAITMVDLTAACIKHVDRRGFEINTPFKSFCFTAESEHEREEWIEAVQESIVETLSNYEVAEKIWFNQSNRGCADCRAPNPEWASINLGVVICKMCAGQHRFLGSGISQVRSLKLDSSVWTNELVEFFLEVGNENANRFWAANLPPEEEIHMGSSPEQRATFHRRKYKERKYRRVLEGFKSQEELNKALCDAVLQPDVLLTMALVFSGADVMCATGHPDYSTPYLLAQKGGQRLQMEFLYHNQLSEFAKLEMVGDSGFPVDVSSFMDGFLYCSANMLKSTLDRKGKDDMVRRWCTLEGGYISYYDGEKSAAPIGRVEIGEMVSVPINNTETMTGAGAVFTFEIYLQSEKIILFGAQTSESQRAWIHAIIKCFTTARVESLLKKDCELIGRLYYKEGHDLYHWRRGWFSLVGSELFFCPEAESMTEAVIQLKRLQELTVSVHSEGEEKIQVLLMVESGRTIYIHGFTKQDFALWHSAIQLAAGRDGRALSNQQLTKNDIPIIIDSCIAFVTQYGLCHQGIYQKNGDPKRVAQLLDEFTSDARNVKLRIQDHRLEDVTDTLKSFLTNCEDALLAKELYPYWISALDLKNEKDRVEKYSTYIQSLPKINRSTLAALLQHLYRIQSCSHINQMKTQSLACVFSSCLFQTGGHTLQEMGVVEDLINNYIQLFSLNEEQVRQMERENSFITRWKDTTFSPAGDLIFEVYLEKKEPERCCLTKVSPMMCSDELTNSTLEMKGIVPGLHDLWTLVEVIETGELERPLHYKEKILEQVLEWSTLEDPSSAFLLIKKYPGSRMSHHNSDDQKEFSKGEHLKFKDATSKLLSGHKFQDKYLVLRDKKLLLYKDAKSAKPEKEVPVESVKCYLGVRKKMKPSSSWGFTVYMQKQQWYFCCEGKDSQLDWVTAIIRSKHQADLWPEFKAKSKSSDQQSSRERGSSHQGSESAAFKHSKEDNKKLAVNITSDMVKSRNSEECDYKQRLVLLENCIKQKNKKTDPVSGPQVAASGGYNPLQRQRMDVVGSLETGEFISSNNYSKPPQKKAMLEAATVQMPQSLLNELSTVLSQTGRRPRDES
ncbi:arf-GAP with Rho-GAP domain, ANK repeat and PH domain-containing protein 2 [Trichomycterus rosablanca]|uniref:arf-GAP with Rho-GAP domain, ANK repeat and PH domain-containing protein 2 n=1 Tax=Trichomycterus rosablanca TaxID=2290929 RepID=UPI002F35409C